MKKLKLKQIFCLEQKTEAPNEFTKKWDQKLDYHEISNKRQANWYLIENTRFK